VGASALETDLPGLFLAGVCDEFEENALTTTARTDKAIDRGWSKGEIDTSKHVFVSEVSV
jgi:hypothetical protein